jgi:hypothetical protein
MVHKDKNAVIYGARAPSARTGLGNRLIVRSIVL